MRARRWTPVVGGLQRPAAPVRGPRRHARAPGPREVERRGEPLQSRFPRGTGVSVTRWSPKPQRQVRFLGPPLEHPRRIPHRSAGFGGSLVRHALALLRRALASAARPASRPSAPRISAVMPRPLLAPPVDFAAPVLDAAGVDWLAPVWPASGPASWPATSSMIPPLPVTLILGEGCSAVSDGSIQCTTCPLL